MTFDEAKEVVKRDLKVTDYLEKAPNAGYICPNCGSGTGVHKTGAVKVYEDTNTYYCHACNEGGDIIKILERNEDCDFITAVKIGAERLGVAIENAPSDRAKKPKDKYTKPEIKTDENGAQAPDTAKIIEYLAQCRERLTAPAPREYLEKRGIDLYLAQALGLGYDPAADPAGKGYPTPRVTIPYHDGHGYTTRRIDGNDKFKSVTLKGVKSNVSFVDESCNAKFNGTETAPPIFVVEGWADALSIWTTGKAPAISINSTGNAEKLLDLIKENRKAWSGRTFIICMDNDDAGKKAAPVLLQGLKALDLKAIEFDIADEYNDANDALTGDRDGFIIRVEAAIYEAQKTQATRLLERIKAGDFKTITSGLAFLDNLTDGVIPQSLMVLLALPAAGKSMLAAQLAEALAAQHKKVLYLCLEMTQEQMLARAWAAMFGEYGHDIGSQKILNYDLCAEDMALLEEIVERYSREREPYIEYMRPQVSTTETIQEILTAYSRAENPPYIVLDYMHLVNAPEKERVDSIELIKKVTMMLKTYAMNTNRFALAIGAVNRESVTSGHITMASGRDSSAIEYTADYVYALNYEAVEKGEVKITDSENYGELLKRPQKTMIIRCLKSRNGIGAGRKQTVTFDAARSTFTTAYSERYTGGAGNGIPKLTR